MILDNINFDNYSENVGDYVFDCKNYFYNFSLNIKYYNDSNEIVFFNTLITKSDFVQQNIKNYDNMLTLFFDYIAYQYIEINYHKNITDNLSYYNLSLLCGESKQVDNIELNYIQKYEILKPYLVKLFLFNSVKYLDFDNNFLDEDDFSWLNPTYKVLEIVLNHDLDANLDIHIKELLQFLDKNSDLFEYDFDNNFNENLYHDTFLIIVAK